MKARIFTKSIIVLMIMALLLPCIPVIASAEDLTAATYTADSAWYGDGSASEFTISDADDLAYFMQLGTQGVTFQGKTVKLGADIVWNDGVASENGFVPSTAQGNKIYKWTPGSAEFKGIFDGQGHTISGLYIESTKASTAFIGKGRDCTVQNVSFDNAYVTASGGTGVNDIAIVLGTYYGNITITNVHTNGHVVTTSKGTVSQFTQAGSIAGGPRYNTAILTISNCTASGSVEGKQHVGGIVGSVWAKTGSIANQQTRNLEMTDCINYATVKGETAIGGLVGNLASAASLTRCTSFGAVIQSSTAVGSGSLVAIRSNNAGTALTIPTGFKDCAMVYMTDCFYAPNASSSNEFPVFVNTTQCGHRIVTRYSDVNNGTTAFKDYTLFPTHANVKNTTNHSLAQKIKDNVFNAYETGAGMLQVPAKGTDVVAVEGVQTKVTGTTYAARFLASVDLTDMSATEINSITSIGFEVAILNDYAVNGAATAIKTQACNKVYTSVLSNYGLDTVSAEEDYAADYIGTLVIEGIPASGLQNILVRAYYTVGDATYYSEASVYSFINGAYAGGAFVSTVTSDSSTTVSLAVDRGTETYDLAALLPDQAEGITVKYNQTEIDGTTVPLFFGLNAFLTSYQVGGEEYSHLVKILRRDQHRVIFNSNGGSFIPSIQVADGESMAWNADTMTPDREGYQFLGWYTEAGERVWFSSYTYTADTVFYARWAVESNKTYTVPDYSQLEFATSSAALNINWRDYDNAFEKRPESVLCTLTAVSDGTQYRVRVTEDQASFIGASPVGAEISRGAGNWTVKITGLTEDYTFVQKAASPIYDSQQSGTTVVNTLRGAIPSMDDSAALYTANGRLYDYAGNVVVLKGVVTVNVGTKHFVGNTSIPSLNRLKQEGVNCIRVTMQLLDGTVSNIGYCKQSGGSAVQTAARKAELMNLLMTAVDNASSLGMYCIIDWGILGINPQNYQEEAIEFFTDLAKTYRNNPYVIFELCNEPKVTNGTWHTTVKPYCEAVLSAIRKEGCQNVAIVAPNDYAKRIAEHTVTSNKRTDDPIDHPLETALSYNVAYTFHNYSYNHEYTNTTSHNSGFGWRLKEAVEAGLTVVTTEFSPAISNIEAQSTGVMLASTFEANKYLNVMLEYDMSYFLFRYLSYFETGETSSQHMFVKGQNASLDQGTWTYDMLTECGKWFYDEALQSDGFIKAADWTPSTPR